MMPYAINVDDAITVCLLPPNGEVDFRTREYMDDIAHKLEEACTDMCMTAEHVVQLGCVVAQISASLADQALAHVKADQDI